MPLRVRKRPGAHASSVQLLMRPAAHASSVQGVEPRLYRHITYRSTQYQKGWIVQWNGRTWGGFHETQREAAKELQRAMGLPRLSMLPKLPGTSSVQPQPVSRSKGVYWKKQRGRWTTRDSSKGYFDSPAEAALATGAKRKQLKPTTIVQRVKFMRRIFDAHEGPADLEDLESRAESLQQVCQQESALEPIVVQLKYGPWRAALIESWKASLVLQCPASVSIQQRALLIFQVRGGLKLYTNIVVVAVLVVEVVVVLVVVFFGGVGWGGGDGPVSSVQ